MLLRTALQLRIFAVDIRRFFHWKFRSQLTLHYAAAHTVLNFKLSKQLKWNWNETVSKLFWNCFVSASFRCANGSSLTSHDIFRSTWVTWHNQWASAGLILKWLVNWRTKNYACRHEKLKRINKCIKNNLERHSAASVSIGESCSIIYDALTHG